MTLQKLTLFCVFCVMQCVYAARGSNLFKNTHTHLTLYQLHIYSLTASFSCKTNTRFLFSIFYILVFIKKKLPTCTALG